MLYRLVQCSNNISGSSVGKRPIISEGSCREEKILNFGFPMRLWGMQLSFEVAGKDVPSYTKKPEQQGRQETERKEAKSHQC